MRVYLYKLQTRTMHLIWCHVFGVGLKAELQQICLRLFLLGMKSLLKTISFQSGWFLWMIRVGCLRLTVMELNYRCPLLQNTASIMVTNRLGYRNFCPELIHG